MSLIALLCRLAEETARIEDALAQPHACEALLAAFMKSRGATFENLLGPFLKVRKHTSSSARVLILCQ